MTPTWFGSSEQSVLHVLATNSFDIVHGRQGGRLQANSVVLTQSRSVGSSHEENLLLGCPVRSVPFVTLA
jgi:hypothetical protein